MVTSRKRPMTEAVVIGLLLMFTASYIDSLRGPLLPVLQQSLALDQRTLSVFLIAGHGAAIMGTVAVLFLFNRVREDTLLRNLLIVSGALGLLCLCSESMAWFLALGALFGLVNTTLGTLSNIWVLKTLNPDKAARVMSGLHMLYGLGSLVATSFFGILLKAAWDWRLAVVITWIPLLGIGLLVAKSRRQRPNEPVNVESTKLGPMHLLFLGLFAAYVASEVTTSMWLSSYLHQVAGKSLASGSFYTSSFFLVMSLSRALCFFIAVPRLQIILLWSGVLLPALFHLIGHMGYPWAFVLTGLYGPFFPLLMARIKASFPGQWRSMTTWVGIAVQSILALIHFSVGSLADRFGIGFAYFVPLWSCLLLAALLAVYLWLERKPSRLSQASA